MPIAGLVTVVLFPFYAWSVYRYMRRGGGRDRRRLRLSQRLDVDIVDRGASGWEAPGAGLLVNVRVSAADFGLILLRTFVPLLAFPLIAVLAG